jgi:hypothetical protein
MVKGIKLLIAAGIIIGAGCLYRQDSDGLEHLIDHVFQALFPE